MFHFLNINAFDYFFTISLYVTVPFSVVFGMLSMFSD